MTTELTKAAQQALTHADATLLLDRLVFAAQAGSSKELEELLDTCLRALTLRPQAVPMNQEPGDLPCGESSSDGTMSNCLGMGLHVCNGCVHGITAPAATESTRGAHIKATMFHDAGAYAECGACGRYSDDPKTLSDRQPVCDCGKQHYWSGSFKPPGPYAKWSNHNRVTAPAGGEG